MRAIAASSRRRAGGWSWRGTTSRPSRSRPSAQLAYVPDDPKLFDTLTVWEHFGSSPPRTAWRDWRPRRESLLEQFELTEKRDALAAELSRGMRQKVAICCGYLHDPRAILLDEPLTGLDPRGIRTMKDSIRDRAAGRGGGRWSARTC